MGLGLTYLSGTDDILTGVVAQKQFFFGPTLNPLSLKVKGQADYNMQTQQVLRHVAVSCRSAMHADLPVKEGLAQSLALLACVK